VPCGHRSLHVQLQTVSAARVRCGVSFFNSVCTDAQPVFCMFAVMQLIKGIGRIALHYKHGG